MAVSPHSGSPFELTAENKTSVVPHYAGVPRVLRAMLGPVLFLLGIGLLDLLVARVGEHQIAKSLWMDDVYAPISRPAEWDWMITGDCRALPYQAAELSKVLNARVINTGVSAVGLGHEMLVFKTLLSHPARKNVVFVIDDDLLGFEPFKLEPETERLSVWWPHFDDRYRSEILELAGVPWAHQWLLQSALYRFRGRGAEMVRAIWREIQGQLGGNHAFPIVTEGVEDTSLIGKREQFKNYGADFWDPTTVSLQVYDSGLAGIKKAGFKPILVLAPMHELRSTEAVNKKVIEQARLLAERHRLPLINYLSYSAPWTKDDRLWANPGHLNVTGAIEFTARLAADLKKVNP